MRVMCCVLRVTGYDKRYAICNLPCLPVYVFTCLPPQLPSSLIQPGARRAEDVPANPI